MESKALDVDKFLNEIATTRSTKTIPIKYNLHVCIHRDIESEVDDIVYTTQGIDKIASKAIRKKNTYADSHKIYYFVSTEDVANSEYVPLVHDDSPFDRNTKERINTHSHYIKVKSRSTNPLGDNLFCITRHGNYDGRMTTNYTISFFPTDKQQKCDPRFFIKLRMVNHGVIDDYHVVDASIMVCEYYPKIEHRIKSNEWDELEKERKYLDMKSEKLRTEKARLDRIDSQLANVEKQIRIFFDMCGERKRSSSRSSRSKRKWDDIHHSETKK